MTCDAGPAVRPRAKQYSCTAATFRNMADCNWSGSANIVFDEATSGAVRRNAVSTLPSRCGHLSHFTIQCAAQILCRDEDVLLWTWPSRGLRPNTGIAVTAPASDLD